MTEANLDCYIFFKMIICITEEFSCTEEIYVTRVSNYNHVMLLWRFCDFLSTYLENIIFEGTEKV